MLLEINKSHTLSCETLTKDKFGFITEHLYLEMITIYWAWEPNHCWEVSNCLNGACIPWWIASSDETSQEIRNFSINIFDLIVSCWIHHSWSRVTETDAFEPRGSGNPGFIKPTHLVAVLVMDFALQPGLLTFVSKQHLFQKQGWEHGCDKLVIKLDWLQTFSFF